MPNASAEQLSQDRHDEMTMHADPATTLKVIPAKFFFRFAKARFDFPSSKRDSQQVTKRPATSPRHSVAKEVLDLTGADVDGDDERTNLAQQFAVMRLAIASVPLNVPYFRSLVRVSHAVTLWRLVAKGR